MPKSPRRTSQKHSPQRVQSTPSPPRLFYPSPSPKSWRGDPATSWDPFASTEPKELKRRSKSGRKASGSRPAAKPIFLGVDVDASGTFATNPIELSSEDELKQRVTPIRRQGPRQPNEPESEFEGDSDSSCVPSEPQVVIKRSKRKRIARVLVSESEDEDVVTLEHPQRKQASQVEDEPALEISKPVRKKKRVIIASDSDAPDSEDDSAHTGRGDVRPDAETSNVAGGKFGSTQRRLNGLAYNRRDRFNESETRAMDEVIDVWCQKHSIDVKDVLLHISTKPQSSPDTPQREFWDLLTDKLPDRSQDALRSYILREYDPKAHQGHWKASEDARLRSAVEELGTKWTKVSVRVGRKPADCANRWSHVLKFEGERDKGKWPKEDEELLVKLVMELTDNKAVDHEVAIPWTTVANRMNAKRSIQQCIFKWQVLRKKLKNGGVKPPRWGALQTYHLMNQMMNLDVDEYYDIKWREFAEEAASSWNSVWGPYELSHYYRKLAAKLPGQGSMTLKETIRALHEANPPPPGAVLASMKSGKAVIRVRGTQQDDD